jgi:hypothetical protein
MHSNQPAVFRLPTRRVAGRESDRWPARDSSASGRPSGGGRRHGTRQTRTALRGGSIRPSATRATARPDTVSPGINGRRGTSTVTPTGHQDGRRSSDDPVFASRVAAHPRPPSARGNVELSVTTSWPAPRQSRGGFHGPNVKPKQSDVSALSAGGGDWPIVARAGTVASEARAMRSAARETVRAAPTSRGKMHAARIPPVTPGLLRRCRRPPDRPACA